MRFAESEAKQIISEKNGGTAQKILELITADPAISRKTLAVQIGISTDGVKYHLNRMRKQNLILRIGPDRGGHWEIIDN